MSYIPDTRRKYNDELFEPSTSKEKPNYYYEGLITDHQRTFIDGYDACVEDIIKSVFQNLTIWEDTLKRFNIDAHRLDMSAILENEEIDIDDDKIKGLSRDNKLLLVLADAILDFAESKRDEIIVSMIESQEDDKYKENFKREFGIDYDNGRKADI